MEVGLNQGARLQEHNEEIIFILFTIWNYLHHYF